MNVVVTGGAGFIGSHVTDFLLAKHHIVHVVDNLSSGCRKNLPKGIHFHRLDVGSKKLIALFREIRPEAVFHLAAQIDVRRSTVDPLFDAQTNVLGTIQVCQAAGEAGGKKIIFSSTGGAIYGEQERFPASEDHPCRPVSPYGTSKLCAENYLFYFERAGGPKVVSLRYANVYGPRQDPHGEAGVVAIFSRKMLSGSTPTIFGDGGQTRDYVYVKDVARANGLALECQSSVVLNIGTGVETDVNVLCSMLAKAAGYKGKPEYDAARPGEQRRSVVDPKRAMEVLGWKPSVGLEEGLRETVEFFNNHSG
jgi:UDP-glucose 4-epimerase